MAFKRILNTLCPYTEQPLVDILIDLEHVLPAGLGAPKKFGVKASEKMNKFYNETIDEPFLCEPFIKFISATTGVKSRSGKVNFSQKVRDEILNEDVIVNFNSEAFTPKMMIPVKKGNDGEINAVIGYGDDAKNELDRLSKKLSLKGKVVVGKEYVQRESNPLKINISMDLNLLTLQLMKSAYLLAVYVFGDGVILSKQGKNVRTCLNNKLVENVKMQLEWSVLPVDLNPRVDKSIHTLFCFKTSDYICSNVCLFGNFKASLFFEVNDNSLDDFSGGVFYLDFKKNKMEHKKFIEHLVEVSSN
ncbi:hypothetical protein NNU90_004230 [Citrobacter farmeri]|uniref:hypothetical protein n=1 Tax=Citrobacter farmeri TaxID=67824 RepID=UPI001902D669|nr:hypothetical protein [Citrobacter farmeri]EKV7296624.1 hypothetical protein [Citrobacter farmeri]EKW5936967.1 hypothetical protein [Citrobacter farmeri]MBJ8745269.1 hypothetical protein [Citrobacter farmeri]MBJ8758196.1 hypothetical protein [Citrobacter farmeri]MBJ9016766.1 hypothetical protein [Citrobacter farmeri]